MSSLPAPAQAALFGAAMVGITAVLGHGASALADWGWWLIAGIVAGGLAVTAAIMERRRR